MIKKLSAGILIVGLFAVVYSMNYHYGNTKHVECYHSADFDIKKC